MTTKKAPNIHFPAIATTANTDDDDDDADSQYNYNLNIVTLTGDRHLVGILMAILNIGMRDWGWPEEKKNEALRLFDTSVVQRPRVDP